MNEIKKRRKDAAKTSSKQLLNYVFVMFSDVIEKIFFHSIVNIFYEIVLLSCALTITRESVQQFDS